MSREIKPEMFPPEIAQQILAELANFGDEDTRVRIAASNNCPEVVLAILAHDRDVNVAANCLANAKTLDKLARDYNPLVRFNVACNQSASDETLAKLSESTYSEISSAAKATIHNRELARKFP